MPACMIWRRYDDELWTYHVSLFFFSSRRRHTRFDCDWSSDVCSSDLHAALKYQGRNYYEYAREGIEIPRPGREVVIHSMTLDACTPPDLSLTIRCGKGTYVRVLAEDIGLALCCGAHLAALRRLATGGVRVRAS